jgi:hypothetical protein
VHRRNLEALAARLTGEFVVDADEVIAQLGELRPVALVGVGRQAVFLRAAHPAELVVARAPAARAGVAAGALFGSLGEERAFVEGHAGILAVRAPIVPRGPPRV